MVHLLYWHFADSGADASPISTWLTWGCSSHTGVLLMLERGDFSTGPLRAEGLSSTLVDCCPDRGAPWAGVCRLRAWVRNCSLGGGKLAGSGGHRGVWSGAEKR